MGASLRPPNPRENQSIRTSQESALAPTAAVRVVFPKLKREIPDSIVASEYLEYTGRTFKRSFIRGSSYNWFALSDRNSLSKLNI